MNVETKIYEVIVAYEGTEMTLGEIDDVIASIEGLGDILNPVEKN